jgi:hypothetical protein
MSFDIGILIVQLLWWLTLVELTVLLLILFWRVRQRHFPWFMASLFLVGLRSVLSRLAHDVPSITMNAVSIAVNNLASLVALLVLVELARQVFAGVKRKTWILWTLAFVAVAAGSIIIWGPWPKADTVSADSTVAILGLLELVAQKSALLVNILTVELCLLVFYFGGRLEAGWHTYKQRLAIGLSTSAMGQLIVLGLWQLIEATAVPKDLTDFLRIQSIGKRLLDANMVVYLTVLVWWMITLGKTRGRRLWQNPNDAPLSHEAPLGSSPSRRSF